MDMLDYFIYHCYLPLIGIGAAQGKVFLCLEVFLLEVTRLEVLRREVFCCLEVVRRVVTIIEV